MSAIDDLTTVPDQPQISEGNKTFSQKTFALWLWIRTRLVPAMVELRDLIVSSVTGAFSGTSATSVTIVDTGEVSITTDAGRSFKPGTPVRLANVADPRNYIDGITKSYNSTTGAFVFYALAKAGSGTFTSWSLTIIPSGGGLAGLGSNTFLGAQYVPDDAYNEAAWNGSTAVPTKNAIRTKIESIISAMFALVTSVSDASLASDSDTVAISSKWGNKKYLIQRSVAQTLSGAAAYDFAVPAGAKRVWLHLSKASLSTGDTYLVQLGTSSGIENTGYDGGITLFAANTVDPQTLSSGIAFVNNGAASTNTVSIPLVNVPGTNTWVSSFSISNSTGRGCNTSCSKDLAGVLTTVRVTRAGSTGLFDNGSGFISWEF